MEVFAALADPTRWRVLSLLAERGEATATTLAGDLPVSRVAVVKHLAVLDRAGPGRGAAHRAREVRYTVRPERLSADRPAAQRDRRRMGRAACRDQGAGRSRALVSGAHERPRPLAGLLRPHPGLRQLRRPVGQVGQATGLRQGGRPGDHLHAPRRDAPRRAGALLLGRQVHRRPAARLADRPGLRGRPRADGARRLRPLRARALRALGARHRDRDRAGRHPDHPHRLPPALPRELDRPQRGRRDEVLHPPPGPHARVRRVAARAQGALAGRRRRQRRPPDEHRDPPDARRTRPRTPRPSSAARSTRSSRSRTTRSCTRCCSRTT